MNVKLDRRIRIEERLQVPDPTYGTPSDQWVPVAEVWAEIQDELPSKGESTSSNVEVAALPARVRVRYHPMLRVDNTMRVLELDRNNRESRVASLPANIGGRNEHVEFMIERSAPQGDA